MDSSEILIEIRKIVRSINLESKRIQKDFGISIPQLLSLNYLKKCPNYQSTHKELRTYLNLNSSTVTGIVNRLERKGLIARLPKREDKRVTYLTLTSAGSKVLDESPDLLQDKLSQKLTNLTAEEVSSISESLRTLTSLLGIQEIEAAAVLTIEDPLQPEAQKY